MIDDNGDEAEIERSDATDRVHEVLPPWRGLPRAVWAATVLWIALMVVWSLVLPTFRPADESQHVAAGVHLEHHHDWPGFKALPPDQGVYQAVFTYRVAEFSTDPYKPLSSSDALPRGDRPSFADLGAGSQREQSLTVGQHPPGYYAIIGAVSWMLPDSTPADVEVWLLRLISVVMLAPLPAVIAVAVRLLGGPDGAVAAASILPFGVPELAVVGGSVNNDNLLNGAAVWVTLGVVVVAGGDLRRRTGALVGAALAVALLAKAFALLLVPVVVAAYLLGGHRSGRWRAALPALGCFALTSMLGGWWWVNNLFRYGQVQPSGHMAPRAGGRLSVGESLGPYVEHALDLVPGRFWAMMAIKGGTATEKAVAFPWGLTAALSSVLLAVLVAAVVRRRTHSATRADVGLLLTPFALVAGTLLVSTWNIYARTEYPAGLQGRYLFVGLPGVFTVVALVLSEWAGDRWRDLLPILVAGPSLVFTAVSLHRAVRFHWGVDRSSLTGVPGAILTWSPMPRLVTLGIGALFVAAVVGLVLVVLVERRSSLPRSG